MSFRARLAGRDANCQRPYATVAASTPTTNGTTAGATAPPMIVITVAPAMMITSPAAAITFVTDPLESGLCTTCPPLIVWWNPGP